MKKILFVENHKIFARAVVEIFLTDYIVTIVPSVAIALEELESNDFDIMLIDYDLDDGKGDIVVRSARQKGKKIKIVAVSAHIDGNLKLTEAGADLVCQKSLFHTIGTLLKET